MVPIDTDLLVCPDCHGSLSESPGGLTCRDCEAHWPHEEGFPKLFRESHIHGSDRFMRLFYNGFPAWHDPLTHSFDDIPGFVRLWCTLLPIHDAARFASIGVLVAAVAAGLGVEAATTRGPLWTRLVAGVVAIGVLVQVTAQTTREILDPHKWQVAEVPATARFLREAAPGPVAELPFDRSGQFLSVLAAPGSPRLNPLRPGDHPPINNPFVVWLYAAGKGEVAEPLPTVDEAHASGLRWVFYDASRCASAGGPGATCSAQVPAALTEILGPASLAAPGVSVWDLAKASGYAK